MKRGHLCRQSEKAVWWGRSRRGKCRACQTVRRAMFNAFSILLGEDTKRELTSFYTDPIAFHAGVAKPGGGTGGSRRGGLVGGGGGSRNIGLCYKGFRGHRTHF